MTWTKEDTLLCRLLFYPNEKISDKAEYEFLIHCIYNIQDWDSFIEKIAIEFISPLIHYRLKTLGLEKRVPPVIAKTIEKSYAHNLSRNLSILGEAKRVFTQFKKSGLDFIVLKGLALTETVYPHFALRKMSDIDLLVKREQLSDIDRCLSDLKYEAVDGRPDRAINNPSGYLASLEYRRDHSRFLSFHIHWHPVNSSTPATALIEKIDVPRIWEKSVPARIADVETHLLCPLHQIIFLCEHALRAGHSFDRLILMYDIHRVITSYAAVISWDELIQETRRFGLSRLVYSGLSIVRRFGGSVPNSVLAGLKPRPLTVGERLFLYLQFHNFRIRGSSLFVYLAMNKGIFAKIRFIFRIFFPPAAIILQKKYIKTGEFRTRHYFSRAWEIASHFISVFRHPTKKNT